ncbi:hypothetical protein OG393_02000 [Streptomyces sp. NBC_01216]|uniref:hypothetical protein n=1 Tax=Streptomyces sp. NBC_01216 TaxID=2903778 RepID=UPI002E124300|nr:hypothetical protein OG393_02000 [Streptomyces sp. NBC_01216]
MTRFPDYITAPTSRLDFDPYRFPALFVDGLPEEAPSPRGPGVDLDHVPAPSPESRLSVPLRPADRRRLELHAALTTAGIAPLPGDLDAIEELCGLDDTTHLALQRWITRVA